jgi:transcriptional regulator with XRE-family HTH domain
MGLRANFSRYLRWIRAAKGLSQEYVALEASINRAYLSDLEREVYSTSLDIAERVAIALNVDPLDLLKSSLVGPKDKHGRSKRKGLRA